MTPEEPAEEFVKHYLLLVPCLSFSDFQKVLDLKVRRRPFCCTRLFSPRSRRAYVEQTRTIFSTSSSPAPRPPLGSQTPRSSPHSTWTPRQAPSPLPPLQASHRRNLARISTSLARCHCCRVGMGVGYLRRWGRGERTGEGRRRFRGWE